jgi:pilus assembly protein CpaE
MKNIIVVTKNEELKQTIKKVCEVRMPKMNLSSISQDVYLENINAIPLEADIFLVESSNDGHSTELVLRKLAEIYPLTPIILLVTNQSQILLLQAIRAGVREVVNLPLVGKDLNEALDRVNKKISLNEFKNGKILSFLSCKGGSGVTFLSANTAYGLAELANKNTLLIDLNLQFGDAALYISDQKPTTTLADVCMEINRLDSDLLESSLIRVTPNCGVLAASTRINLDQEVNPEQIEIILELAKKNYEFILIDLGRQLTSTSLRALDKADIIFPILQQTLPYLRDGKQLIDMFLSFGYPKEKIEIIINRQKNDATVTLKDLEKTLAHEISHKMPNNFEVVNNSINLGVSPLEASKNSNLSKSLIEFVRHLTGIPVVPSKGIIRRLFNFSPILE